MIQVRELQTQYHCHKKRHGRYQKDLNQTSMDTKMSEIKKYSK